MRIAPEGGHGEIRLDSASLRWESAPPAGGAANSSTGSANSSCSLPPGGSRQPSCPRAPAAGPSVRVDGESLEAVGFSDAVRLGAARSFDLAVTGFDTEGKEGGGDGTEENERVVRQGQGQGQGQQEQAEGRRSRLGSPAALLRGDSGSMNARAGFINVEVGANRSRTEQRVVLKRTQHFLRCSFRIANPPTYPSNGSTRALASVSHTASHADPNAFHATPLFSVLYLGD